MHQTDRLTNEARSTREREFKEVLEIFERDDTDPDIHKPKMVTVTKDIVLAVTFGFLLLSIALIVSFLEPDFFSQGTLGEKFFWILASFLTIISAAMLGWISLLIYGKSIEQRRINDSIEAPKLRKEIARLQRDFAEERHDLNLRLEDKEYKLEGLRAEVAGFRQTNTTPNFSPILEEVLRQNSEQQRLTRIALADLTQIFVKVCNINPISAPIVSSDVGRMLATLPERVRMPDEPPSSPFETEQSDLLDFLDTEVAHNHLRAISDRDADLEEDLEDFKVTVDLPRAS